VLLIFFIGVAVMGGLQGYSKALKRRLAQQNSASINDLVNAAQAARQLDRNREPAQSVTEHTTELLPAQPARRSIPRKFDALAPLSLRQFLVKYLLSWIVFTLRELWAKASATNLLRGVLYLNSKAPPIGATRTVRLFPMVKATSAKPPGRRVQMKRTLIAKVLIAILLLPTTGLAQTSSARPVAYRTQHSRVGYAP